MNTTTHTLGITHTLRNGDHSRFVSFENGVGLGRKFVKVKYSTSGCIPANHTFIVGGLPNDFVQLHSGVGDSMSTPIARRVWNCLIDQGWTVTQS